jgi:hypothetical protein
MIGRLFDACFSLTATALLGAILGAVVSVVLLPPAVSYYFFGSSTKLAVLALILVALFGGGLWKAFRHARRAP